MGERERGMRWDDKDKTTPQDEMQGCSVDVQGNSGWLGELIAMSSEEVEGRAPEHGWGRHGHLGCWGIVFTFGPVQTC